MKSLLISTAIILAVSLGATFLYQAATSLVPGAVTTQLKSSTRPAAFTQPATPHHTVTLTTA